MVVYEALRRSAMQAASYPERQPSDEFREE